MDIPPSESDAGVSTVVSRGPCDQCGSSDGNVRYSDGHTHCFVCERHCNNPLDAAPGDLLRGRALSLPQRGLTRETCRFAGYLVGKHNGRECQIAQYHNDKAIVAQKLRFEDKTFCWLGAPKGSKLFGEHLWRNTGNKRVVITEGEIDALSVMQAFGCRWPVVSLRDGASSAAKGIQGSLDFIESHEEIVLWFDNDDPGKAAVESVVPLLTPGKVRVATGPDGCKDANDVLVKHGLAEVTRCVYEAKIYRPDGIITGADLLPQLSEFYSNGFGGCSFSVPYPILNAKLRGFRKGELYIFTAGSGIGKSTVVRELAFHLMMQHGCRIGYIGLEEKPMRTGLAFMSIYLNRPLHLTMEGVSREAYEHAARAVVDNGRLFVFDHWGSLKIDALLNRLRYLALASQVDFIILDHISIVISGLGLENERTAIDVLLTRLRTLCEQTGVGILAITHLRKAGQQQKAAEDGGRVSLSDLRGSSSLYQLADGVISLIRNPCSRTTNANVSTLELLKNRFTGEQGICDRLRYDLDTGRLQICAADAFDSSSEETEDAPDQTCF